MRKTRQLAACLSVVVCWITMNGAVWAGDGRREISPGMLPYTIDAAGSYVVTGDLTLSSSANGIRISSDDVSLDLNGYALRGSGSARHGIRVDSGKLNIVIRNGALHDWGRIGISAPGVTNLLLRQVQVYACGQEGILAGTASVLRQCQVLSCGEEGIRTGGAAVVSDCLSRSNSTAGIVVGDNAVVVGCVTRDNGDDGVRTGQAVVVDAVSSRGNGGDGIEAGIGTVVHGCTVSQNTGDGVAAVGEGTKVQQVTAFGNGGYGLDLTSFCMAENVSARNNSNGAFRVQSDAFLLDCAADSNGGPGFLVPGDRVRVERCHATANTVGFELDGSEILMIANTAFANADDDYGVGSGNFIDLIVNPGTSAGGYDNAWSSFELPE